MLKLFLLFLMAFFVAVYFVPSFVAIGRRHAHLLQITILNAFLGWSFIAWVAALIWATTNKIEKNTSTKGAWILIGVFFFLSISPIFVYSIIPNKYKKSEFHETYYKKTIYMDKSGKVINEITETKHSDDD